LHRHSHCIGTDGRCIGTDGRCIGTDGHCIGTDGHCIGTDGHCIATDGHCIGPAGHYIGTDGQGIGISSASHNSLGEYEFHWTLAGSCGELTSKVHDKTCELSSNIARLMLASNFGRRS
jgi:hypothetical protein